MTGWVKFFSPPINEGFDGGQKRVPKGGANPPAISEKHLWGNKKTAKAVGRKILRGGQETQNVVAPLPVLAVELAKSWLPLDQLNS